MINEVEVERVIPILEREIAKHSNSNFHTNIGEKNGGVEIVGFVTGVSPRTISDIRNGKRKGVNILTLDKILTKLDLEHLSYLSPEEGGFKDVYDRAVTRDSRHSGPRAMDDCKCGSLKQARSALCRDCYTIEKRKTRNKCIDCGDEIKSSSTRCWSCWQKSKRSPSKKQKRWNDGVEKLGFGEA